MKAQLSKSIFSLSTALLCAAVISSCGASKESKRQATTTVAEVTAEPTTPPVAQPTIPTTPAQPAGAPVGRPAAEGSVEGEISGNQNDQSAPVGRQNTEQQNGEEQKVEVKNSVPDFSEASAVKTGGQVGELSYTSASDDGIMELFRSKATTVNKEQQEMNSNLAQALIGAKLKKNGSDYNLDLAVNEFGQNKIYKLKATTDGNKLKLSSLSAAGSLEFQGGFVKCLDSSCNTAYAKIKYSGAYTRIIFRTMDMDNHFMIQKDVQDDGLNMWRTYVQNTVQGAATSAKIASVKGSSYEILNGKSAMGIQLTTQDNEALVLNTLLVAPETGTELNQKITKVTDLSMNYNLEATKGKSTKLSSTIAETNLVNNNGKGQLKIKMSFAQGSIWLVLSKVKAQSMSAAEVAAFEATVPNF